MLRRDTHRPAARAHLAVLAGAALAALLRVGVRASAPGASRPPTYNLPPPPPCVLGAAADQSEFQLIFLFFIVPEAETSKPNLHASGAQPASRCELVLSVETT
jgi:hypothetical protein